MSTWDPATQSYIDPETGDRWVHVDPRTYDNQFAQDGPVYTTPAPPTSAPGAAGPSAVPGVPGGYGLDSFPGATAPAPDRMTGGSEAAADAADGSRPPRRGELGLKERRSWRTWQLVTAVLVAAVFGMWLNGSTGSASSTPGKAGYALPAATGSSSGSTTTTAAGGSTSTTAAGSSTSTTTAGSTSTTAAGGSTATTSGTGGSPTSTTVAAGPATVLIPATQLSGNWTSAAFTIAAGQWNIGWAFQCTPAPPTPPTFAIYVVTAGGTPSGTPAVTSAAASGQSVTPQSSLGSQQIVVQASAACRWAVKVTGFSG